MASVFVIDDDPRIRSSLKEFLEAEDYEVFVYPTGEDALPYVYQEIPDLILLDLKLPGMDGLTVLEKIKGRNETIEVVIITGYAEVSSAVRAMKLGAIDYIKKPFNLEEMLLIIEKAVDAKKKSDQLAYLTREERELLGFGEIVGMSKQMQEVFDLIRQVADSPKTSVLICGETGTGKELVAKAIHYNSERAEKPFIEINCSAFQENLLEAELFGYEAGAFTDARQRKKGLFELAHQGSFFLDEIGDMSLEIQSKLLKVIEEQRFRRVGGTKEIKVDTRIISATSQDLKKRITKGLFRQELYYRLNVVTIELPLLNERGEDIILLTEHFVNFFNTEFKRHVTRIDDDVKELLMAHSWPGNVRELKNVIERAVLFEKGELLSRQSVRLFDEPITSTVAISPTPVHPVEFEIPPEGISMNEIEKSLLKKALSDTNGNQTKAAKLLGITRETIKYKMKKYNLK